MYSAHLFIKYTRRIGKIGDEKSAGGRVHHKRGLTERVLRRASCFTHLALNSQDLNLML